MEFFQKYILDRNSTDYQTNTEKDWAFIARREYWYDVVVRSTADAFAVGLCSAMLRMFMIKKFVMWPFFPTFGIFYLY